MNNELNWIDQSVKPLDTACAQQALLHQAQLTKPPGSLGRLEEIAVQLAAMQGTLHPKLNKIEICIFAGDHGITNENVSAYPQEVTAQMLENFVNEGAAISVLAKQLDAKLAVVDVGVNAPLSQSYQILYRRVVNGTANFAEQAALTADELTKAINVGYEIADNAAKEGTDLFIGGEMGIGNTTSATALASAQLEVNVEKLTGPGTGLNAEGVSHKCLVIEQALYLHRDNTVTPLDRLQYFAGAEIAALVGAYIRCAQHGIAVLIDGYISSVAALYAQALNSAVADWFMYAHRSTEPGHRYVLDVLKARPLLELQMRLGEGSGAAMAVSVLKNAIALHNQMATFEQAGVANKTE